MGHPLNFNMEITVRIFGFQIFIGSHKLIIQFSKKFVYYQSGVDVRENTGTSCGGREKQQTQGRSKEMKIQLEVLKPEVLEFFFIWANIN